MTDKDRKEVKGQKSIVFKPDRAVLDEIVGQAEDGYFGGEPDADDAKPEEQINSNVVGADDFSFNPLEHLPVGLENASKGSVAALINKHFRERSSDSDKAWKKVEGRVRERLRNAYGNLLGVKKAERGQYYWENATAKQVWLIQRAQIDVQSRVFMRQLVALALLDKFLHDVLPPEIKEHIAPIYNNALPIAEEACANKLKLDSVRWQHKIDVIDHATNMETMPVSDEVRETVYDAVIRERVLDITYDSNHDSAWKGQLQISPQKLVFRYNHLKVLAYNHDNGQLRELSVRRIQSAKRNNDERFVGKELATVEKTIKLRFKDKYFKEYFESSALSKEQTITPPKNKSDRYSLEARVTIPMSPDDKGPDYFNLLNQLSTWSDAIEIVEPAELRRQMVERLRKAASHYEELIDHPRS